MQQGHTQTFTYDKNHNHYQGKCTHVLTDASFGTYGMVVWGKFKRELGHKQSTLTNITCFMRRDMYEDTIMIGPNKEVFVRTQLQNYVFIFLLQLPKMKQLFLLQLISR